MPHAFVLRSGREVVVSYLHDDLQLAPPELLGLRLPRWQGIVGVVVVVLLFHEVDGLSVAPDGFEVGDGHLQELGKRGVDIRVVVPGQIVDFRLPHARPMLVHRHLRRQPLVPRRLVRPAPQVFATVGLLEFVGVRADQTIQAGVDDIHNHIIGTRVEIRRGTASQLVNLLVQLSPQRYRRRVPDRDDSLRMVLALGPLAESGKGWRYQPQIPDQGTGIFQRNTHLNLHCSVRPIGHRLRLQHLRQLANPAQTLGEVPHSNLPFHQLILAPAQRQKNPRIPPALPAHLRRCRVPPWKREPLGLRVPGPGEFQKISVQKIAHHSGVAGVHELLHELAREGGEMHCIRSLRSGVERA
mmetsp:Transcript_34577/g.83408  ORF Transcript_34577/g.83408 Transcript_34577/m.83408 type:complete len:355 (+) Transcript_34577:491-1555(+)